MEVKDIYIRTKNRIVPAADLGELYALIERVAGKAYKEVIDVELCDNDGFDSYEISDHEGRIFIRGSSGPGIAAGFSAYLKERCGYSVGALDVTGTLPATPPAVGEPIQRRSPYIWRYFFNYCTFCYTYAFDNWEDWEKPLDYLALSGYNLILNPIGLESVWRSVLLELGYSEKEAEDFICGPAFYAWQWMMNLTGWAGGAPPHWYEERLELAGKINRRLHGLGISTASPGFAGMVPADFAAHFPESNPIGQGPWCGFVRPALLMPWDPLFNRAADLFYRESKKIPGAEHTHVYSADPFHEGGVTNGIDLYAYGTGVYRKMAECDPEAVWMLQGWTNTPKPDVIRSIPEDRILIMNLSGDNWQGQELYAGAPWCYCDVYFFGGQYYFYGNPEKVLTNPSRCLEDENTNLVGIGFMPESVNCCGIVYEAFAYAAFSDSTDLESFIRYYLNIRYGLCTERLVSAWKTACREIMNGKSIYCGESALCARPTLDVRHTSSWSTKPDPDADQSILIDFIETLFGEYGCLKNNPAYRRDLMDAVSSLIANYSWHVVDKIKAAYAAKDAEALSRRGEDMLALIDIENELVSSFPDMRLGTWIEKARRHGRTAAEREYFEWNARTLITLWGDRSGASSLRDYAARSWQGLLEDFYRPRWESFLSRLEISLLTGNELESINAYDEELPFVYRKKAYSSSPSGDLESAVRSALALVLADPYNAHAEAGNRESFEENVMKDLGIQ